MKANLDGISPTFRSDRYTTSRLLNLGRFSAPCALHADVEAIIEGSLHVFACLARFFHEASSVYPTYGRASIAKCCRCHLQQQGSKPTDRKGLVGSNSGHPRQQAREH